MATESITEAWLRKHVPVSAGGSAPDPQTKHERTAGGDPPPNARPRRVFDASLPGFGVVIGARFATFVARGRVEVEESGKKKTVRRDVTIGRWQHVGAGDDRSERWTEAKARRRAMHELGKMSHGEDPIEPEPASGPTLRDGLTLHVSNMQKTGGKGRYPNGEQMSCSPESIRNVEDEVTNHLAEWLDRPFVELTTAELEEVVEDILEEAIPRAGSVNPPGLALVKRLVRHVSAIWASTNRKHDLPFKNPAPNVVLQGLAPKEVRIEPGEFKTWHAKVMDLSPVRRDFNRVALFTAVRSKGLRLVRRDDVDFDAHVLHIKHAKGNRPYSIPMTKTVEAILRARLRDNEKEFALHGGDAGYVFPTVTRAKPFRVIPLAAPKEHEGDDDNRVTSMPGPHILRKTWNSVALELLDRVSAEEREALMNHNGRGVNVRHYGFPRNWDALRGAAAAVERALLQRIEGKKVSRRKRRRPFTA